MGLQNKGSIATHNFITNRHILMSMPTADYRRRADQTLENIADSEAIDPRNKELLRDYARDQRLNGLTDATVVRNLSRMKVLAETDRAEPFDKMDKDDLKDLVEWVQRQDYTAETIYTYKNVIRSFWKWMNPTDDGDAPDTVSWIKMNPPNENGKLPKDLLTKEDIKAQIEAAYNDRDKALIAMLYETGARIGELIDLTVGDIEDRENGKKVVIEGKTGARRLPLVESVPHLNDWLNKHPDPKKDAPLWCKIQQGGPDDALEYRYIRDKILKKTMDKAGIEKPSNPHHYRHSRASYLANRLKEAQLCEWFGWVQGSDVPAKYVHLSGRDIDNAYDTLFGLHEPEEDEEKSVRQCWRCEDLNRAGARFCDGCGAPLDAETTVEVEEAEEKTIEDSDTEDIDKARKLQARKLRENNPEKVDELLAELMAVEDQSLNRSA